MKNCSLLSTFIIWYSSKSPRSEKYKLEMRHYIYLIWDNIKNSLNTSKIMREYTTWIKYSLFLRRSCRYTPKQINKKITRFVTRLNTLWKKLIPLKWWKTMSIEKERKATTLIGLVLNGWTSLIEMKTIVLNRSSPSIQSLKFLETLLSTK